MLAEKTPAGFVAFDLLALGDESLVDQPFSVRRARLEKELGRADRSDVPHPHDDRRRPRPRAGSTQFEGAGLDGVVAKPLGAPYQQNARTMLKIKHERTADVVLAGYRLHKTSTPERPLLGSLLLGLYADGKLQHIGVSASFTEARRAELIDELQPLEMRHRRTTRGASGANGRSPTPTGSRARRAAGAPARTCRSRRCGPSVCSRSATTHMEGRRFRHTAQFKRWRPDRDPESCGYEQLERAGQLRPD